MALSTQDIADLRARVLYAHHHGFGIAKAADYVAALGGRSPTEGVEAGSTAQLLALIDGEVPEAPPTLMSGMSGKQAKRAAAEKAAAEKAAAEKAAAEKAAAEKAAAAVQDVVAVADAVVVDAPKADEKP